MAAVVGSPGSREKLAQVERERAGSRAKGRGSEEPRTGWGSTRTMTRPAFLGAAERSTVPRAAGPASGGGKPMAFWEANSGDRIKSVSS